MLVSLCAVLSVEAQSDVWRSDSLQEVLKLGVPLLQDAETDVELVAKELNTLYSTYAQQGVVAFMGHGNPDEYDTYKANVRYTQLEEALQKYNKNYFVGTVDMMENFKTHVWGRMTAAGITTGKVFLHPLMSINGDHGHNDMGGDDDDNTVLPYRLLELTPIRKVWMEHTKYAIDGPALEYYHSKNPE